MAVARDRLTEIWEDRPGVIGWLTTVDHKRIGVRYLVTSFIFFMVGGTLALAMRTQLAQPDMNVLSADAYDEAFSMHGTTMIFLFAMPVSAGFGNYLVPLMIGARDMAFPRINAFSYWVFLLSGLFFYSSFLIGQPPNGGWYAYTPLTGPQYSPSLGMDYWTLGIIFLGISTTAGAINFIVTILKLRAPGMSIGKMPIIIWNVLAMAFAIVFALPALTAASTLLFLDRRFGTHFFDVNAGGNTVLWQSLFWIFGHPDVYILFLIPVGIVSIILPVFSRRKLIGYTFLAMAAVSIGFVSFGVWVHHMFATGLSLLEMSYFSAASLMIPIPSAIQMFVWISTIWLGKVNLKTPFMFMIGFLIIFTIGGISGVMQAVVPFDWQVNHSYWVVAHFHYVLIGTVVFPVMGGLYYWFPKITGRMLSDRLGKISFWLLFIGFNLTFLQLHIVGLLGAPRRVYTYPPGLGWDPYFLVSTIGAFIQASAVIVFLFNFVTGLRKGPPAGDNPWGADTLEWSISSPPPAYNFRNIPVVSSRHPVWDRKEAEQNSSAIVDERQRETHLAREDTREFEEGKRTIIGTTLTDADPESVIHVPGPSWWPLALAASMSVFFVALLANLMFLAVIGVTGILVSIIVWLFPPEALPTETNTAQPES